MRISITDAIEKYASNFGSDETCNYLEYLVYYNVTDRTEYNRYRSLVVSNMYGWFYPNSSIEDKDYLLNYQITYDKDLKPVMDELVWSINDCDVFREECMKELSSILEDVYEHDMIEFNIFLESKNKELKITTYDGEL